MTLVAFCGCASGSLGARFQDEVYGRGHRDFNEKKDKEGNREWRCTCCAKIERNLINKSKGDK